jgi:hypothetical protein
MKFKFRAQPNNQGTAWKIRVLDCGKVFFEQDNIRELTNIEYEFDDDVDAVHQVQIEISGKLPSDTVIDQDGNIIKDNVLELTDFVLDEFDVNQIVYSKAVYRHDFNGTQDIINDQFFSTVGCNGVISFEFQSPVYIWLLEVM